MAQQPWSPHLYFQNQKKNHLAALIIRIVELHNKYIEYIEDVYIEYIEDVFQNNTFEATLK